ncbi:MAG TPA: ice-binding family protein, partial [Bryobacteraceae bacterium]|nr:ice-binding family protein [Bryobacteraceae bacterium]
ARADNIFWQVGTSATLGTTSVFHGNILAAVSISVLTGATLDGRALAQSGAVTVDTGGTSLVGVPAPVTGPPVISVSGVVNGASFVAPVTAGSIAAVFGSNLSIGQSSGAIVLPLPTTLAQASFALGTFATPMYFASAGQANVQIPWELAGQTQAQITATVNGSNSGAQTVAIAPFAPGIFSLNMSGSGQGAVLVATTAQLASAATPAARGGYIAIFCTGLGAVSNGPPTGMAAGSSPLSFTLTQPTVTVGGASATVSYSGLAPTLVGLYQVNAIVPSSVAVGNAVPVVVRIGGIDSNTVTIAVQ